MLKAICPDRNRTDGLFHPAVPCGVHCFIRSCYHRGVGVFLKTKFTIEPGLGMGSLSPGHFFWLAVLLLLIVFLGRSYRAFDEDRRRRIRLAVACLIMLDEIAKDIVVPLSGQWEWEFLPLHLCSISVFAVFFHALTGNRLLEEYLYALTLPTAMMAMVFPDWTSALPFWNFMCLHSFTIHLLLVLYPCLLLYGGFRPSARRLAAIVPIVALLAVAMHFVNIALGTNFFFVNGGGVGNPLSLIEGRVGMLYLAAMPVIAAVCWLPMYILPARKSHIKP